MRLGQQVPSARAVVVHATVSQFSFMKLHSKTHVGFLIVAILHLALSFNASAQTGTLRFSSASYSATESGGSVRLTVRRSGGSTGTLTADIGTVDSGGGTATADADYLPTNGTLSFGPGVTSLHFSVPIVNDVVHENAETVIVTLFFNDAFQEATVTIKDNDTCAYSLSTNKVVLGFEGGVAPALIVTATEGCTWTVENTTASATWLGISQTNTATGGEVSLSFDRHSGTSARSATLKVAGKTVTVTQLPEPPPDTQAPVITIRQPTANARQTNDSILVTGTATDNVLVTLVEARLENNAEISDYIPANGTTDWSVSLAGLIPGTNTIRVRARDAANEPTEVTRQVIYVEVSPLGLTTNGVGSVTGVRGGQLLDVGKSYTARAATDRDHLFTGWSGSIATTENPVTFTMQTGFVLSANFVINPFIAVTGTYNGLCHETETNRYASSGYLTVKTTPLGGYSARLILAGARYSFSGQFSGEGQATNVLTIRSSTNTLTVVLAIDLIGSSDQILGSITSGDWAAEIRCDRQLFSSANLAPQAGRYTVVIPGDDTLAAEQPGGAGFGTVNVSTAGRVKLSATLADGTRLSQSTALSKDGYWPLYAPLYGNHGSVISWAVFSSTGESDLAGLFSWFKPAQTGAKFYPAGFAIDQNLTGSRYVAPTNNADPILNFSAGRVQFSAGNLAASFENEITLTNNAVVNLDTNKLTLSINRSSGLFTGSVTPPGTAKSIPFRGAIDQGLNQGWGFFLGTNQSGRVRLGE